MMSRTELLYGRRMMEALSQTRVIVFGVGGVGGWCAEALVRTGIGSLTMVDPDCVSPSNLNRQIMATVRTIGLPKVEVMRDRLLDIRPEADIVARRERYTAETATLFDLDVYDYVVDAIDSLADKALLIRRATESRARLYASMGAARKTDPGQIRVAEFWQVKGCPLAAALRRLYRRTGEFPTRRFRCVYSPELHDNHGRTNDKEQITENKEPCGRLPNGTVCHATASFGLTLAGLIVGDVERRQLIANSE